MGKPGSTITGEQKRQPWGVGASVILARTGTGKAQGMATFDQGLGICSDSDL